MAVPTYLPPNNVLPRLRLVNTLLSSVLTPPGEGTLAVEVLRRPRLLVSPRVTSPPPRTPRRGPLARLDRPLIVPLGRPPAPPLPPKGLRRLPRRVPRPLVRRLFLPRRSDPLRSPLRARRGPVDLLFRRRPPRPALPLDDRRLPLPPLRPRLLRPPPLNNPLKCLPLLCVPLPLGPTRNM